MSNTLLSLTVFIAWSLLLLILMEGLRSKMVVFKEVSANGFLPDNSNLSPFMQRLTRAHANCLEGLPIFGGLMLIAAIADRTNLTDPLAFALLAARLVQSFIHLCSVSPLAVTLRFSAFCIQMGIAAYWAFLLLNI